MCNILVLSAVPLYVTSALIPSKYKYILATIVILFHFIFWIGVDRIVFTCLPWLSVEGSKETQEEDNGKAFATENKPFQNHITERHPDLK